MLLLLLVSACKFSNSSTDDLTPSIPAKQALAHADSIVTFYRPTSKQALVYLDSVYHTLKNPNTADLFGKYKFKAFYYLLYNNNVSNGLNAINAHIYADSMLYILRGKEDKFKTEYTNALFTKGDAFFLEKSYNNAFRYYYKSRQFALENIDACKLAQFTYRLGSVRYKQERYLEAVYYIKEAFREGEKCNSQPSSEDVYQSRQSYLNTIGLCFEYSGKLDSAVYYYKKALNFIDKVSARDRKTNDFMQSARGVVYGNLGGAYAKMNNYKQAEKYLKESIKINDRPRFAQIDAQTAKIKLADTYIRLKRFNEAYKLLNELQLALVRKLPQREMTVSSEMKLYKLQWTYFDQTHDIFSAYRYIQKYFHLKDSITDDTQSLKATDMDMAFRASEEHFQNALLYNANEKKRIYLIVFILFLVVSIYLLIRERQSRLRLNTLNVKISTQNLELQKTLMDLEQSQRQNTYLMKIVAHDLKSPIAAAISVAGLVKTSNISPGDREMLEMLETSSSHSLGMIEDLLSIDTMEGRLTKEFVEMHALLLSCVNLLKLRAAEKKQELKFQAQEVIVNINREKVWRVLNNLIVNAIKFSPSDSIIEIRMYKEQNSVVIAVKDFGIGIPQEMRDRVFDKFTMAKRPGTAGERSSGLGLAISKQIIEAHNGKIWFESEAGRGSTFFFKLPIA